ncbi:diaminobutyrate--2-oxoglutarate transaminase [Malaciobacter mytili]|uniref:diaminobutyrate--2-oxoglutarate transaminase n=1 Tax=Malaciobacter mytili TaxID=603050 RepID=UPI00100B8BFC|nr:diaminobutyrate--2-oxoglutarate transaminase [Malaciobacter mytili]RXI45444.1 diaminobutyrate--2-oxoglutarate transaminase [Malaciobacter mytili]
MRVFENLESEVRGYIRSFPTIFNKAKGAKLTDEQGVEYIDFFAGAGTLNYGHNNEQISKALVEYIQNDGIIHGLDMATTAKKEFMQTFDSLILKPRNLEYKLQFTGPTGTNAVETALKLARLVKGRSNIVAFTNGYHGLSQGSLAVTGNNEYRDESYISRINATFMPFDGYFEDMNTLKYFRKFLEDGSSGMDLPAAVILETIQGEGGINVASKKWLQELEAICREFDILLIIDDIQVGNGRSGEFFSFEFAGINPDMVTLSKSIGGGLPMALLLFKPDLDQWKPGEHTGTFRGNNLAFVASKVSLENYWQNEDLSNAVKYKEKILKQFLEKIAQKYKNEYEIKIRGRGLAYGFEVKNDKSIASELSSYCFEEKLIIETCGSDSQVVKFLPPLVIDEELLKEGLSRFEKAVDRLFKEKKQKLKEEF